MQHLQRCSLDRSGDRKGAWRGQRSQSFRNGQSPAASNGCGPRLVIRTRATGRRRMLLWSGWRFDFSRTSLDSPAMLCAHATRMGTKAKPPVSQMAGGFAVSAQKSGLRVTAPALWCSPCRAGGWIETPHCQFDNHGRVRVGWGFEGTARPWGCWQSRWLAPDGFAV